MSSQSNPIRSSIVTSQRRNSPLALAVLLVVWAGLMVLVLAPKGTFAPQPVIAAGTLR